MKKRIILIVSIVVLIVLAKGLVTQRKNEIKDEPIPQKKSLTVSLTQAKQGIIRETSSYLAVVNANKTIQISTKIAGYIQNIFVEESQKIKKGELLVTIDQNDINSNISILKTTLKQQQNDLKLSKDIYSRNQKLYRVGGLAKERLDTSKVIMEGKISLIQTTKEKISQLQKQKNYLQIKAPFDGVVDKIIMYQGDLAIIGKPIISISSEDKKLIFSFVSTQNSIRKNQKVYSSSKEIGKIDKILTVAKNGLTQAQIKLNDNINLPIGATLNIDVLTKNQKGCIVPNNTILHKTNANYLMIYKDSKFSPLKIDTLITQKNQTLITSCPKEKIAQGSEVLLAKLPIYGEVEIRE